MSARMELAALIVLLAFGLFESDRLARVVLLSATIFCGLAYVMTARE